MPPSPKSILRANLRTHQRQREVIEDLIKDKQAELKALERDKDRVNMRIRECIDAGARENG